MKRISNLRQPHADSCYIVLSVQTIRCRDVFPIIPGTSVHLLEVGAPGKCPAIPPFSSTLLEFTFCGQVCLFVCLFVRLFNLLRWSKMKESQGIIAVGGNEENQGESADQNPRPTLLHLEWYLTNELNGHQLSCIQKCSVCISADVPTITTDCWWSASVPPGNYRNNASK